ncbi:hypothetical protein V6N12_031058 [Hibiscus sabdariffa]|uniref:Uncharacterized protein n=1 Tax=Hibiscus sabdariffa TaxID=183260 RepID=A0ABR2E7S9_9ROSI
MFVSKHVIFNEEVFPAAFSSSISSSAASSEFQSSPFLVESSPVHVPSVPHAATVSSAPIISDSIPASDEISIPHYSEPVTVLPGCSPVAEQQVVYNPLADYRIVEVLVDPSVIEASPIVEAHDFVSPIVAELFLVNNDEQPTDPMTSDTDHHDEQKQNFEVWQMLPQSSCG